MNKKRAYYTQENKKKKRGGMLFLYNITGIKNGRVARFLFFIRTDYFNCDFVNTRSILAAFCCANCKAC